MMGHGRLVTEIRKLLKVNVAEEQNAQATNQKEIKEGYAVNFQKTGERKRSTKWQRSLTCKKIWKGKYLQTPAEKSSSQ